MPSGLRETPQAEVLAGLEEEWPTAEVFEDSDAAGNAGSVEEREACKYPLLRGVGAEVPFLVQASTGGVPWMRRPSAWLSPPFPPSSGLGRDGMDMCRRSTALLVRRLGQSHIRKARLKVEKREGAAAPAIA